MPCHQKPPERCAVFGCPSRRWPLVSALRWSIQASMARKSYMPVSGSGRGNPRAKRLSWTSSNWANVRCNRRAAFTAGTSRGATSKRIDALRGTRVGRDIAREVPAANATRPPTYANRRSALAQDTSGFGRRRSYRWLPRTTWKSTQIARSRKASRKPISLCERECSRLADDAASIADRPTQWRASPTHRTG